jgi:hypothetical protein
MKLLPPVLKGLLLHAPGNAIIASDAQNRTSVYIKLSAPLAPSLKSPLPLRHFFFMAPMPTAPILGWFFEIRNLSEKPRRAVVYINIASRSQFEELEEMKRRNHVEVNFVSEENFQIALTQSLEPPVNMPQMIKAAVTHATEIQKGKYDWFSAWAEFHRLYPPDVISTWGPSQA